VVFDASREVPDSADSPGITALMPWISSLPHLLVVSTTPLPLNVRPVRSGGAPAYPHHEPGFGSTGPAWAEPDIGDVRRPWIADGDQSLLDWTTEALREVAADPGPRLTANQFDELMQSFRPDKPDGGRDGAFTEMCEHAAAWQKARQGDDVVFLSFRGDYEHEVAKLAEAITTGRAGRSAGPALYVEAGRLAGERELLSEGRRWMMLGALDDMLRRSSELWVWHTDDYLKSWWTLGELVSAAYVADRDRSPVTVSTWAPGRGPAVSAPQYEVQLSEEDRKRLARYFANARADQIAPELSVAQRVERTIFRIGLGRPYLGLMGKALRSPIAHSWERGTTGMLGDSGEAEGLLDEVRRHVADREAYRARIFHPAYQPEFWSDLLLDRPGVAYRPEVQALLAAPESMIRIDRREVSTAVRDSRPAVARDGTHVPVREVAPRFFWRPRRLGGVLGGGLTRIPTYLAEA
jgi:hypothetical protein